MAEARGLRALGALATLVTTGCIVAEPPPYEPPPRTPPVLDLWAATPPVGETIAVDRVGDINPEDPTFLDFSVPLRSEDRDEPLQYALHVDYMLPSAGRPPVDNPVAPSTFDDLERVIRFRWEVRGVSDGCHQLTLLVAHESSWNAQLDRPDPERGAGDIAMATWWINVNAAPGEQTTLRDCPTRGNEVER